MKSIKHIQKESIELTQHNNNNQSTDIENLPFLVKEHLFSFLETKDLNHLSLANKSMFMDVDLFKWSRAYIAAEKEKINQIIQSKINALNQLEQENNLKLSKITNLFLKLIHVFLSLLFIAMILNGIVVTALLAFKNDVSENIKNNLLFSFIALLGSSAFSMGLYWVKGKQEISNAMKEYIEIKFDYKKATDVLVHEKQSYEKVLKNLKEKETFCDEIMNEKNEFAYKYSKVFNKIKTIEANAHAKEKELQQDDLQDILIDNPFESIPYISA